MQRFEQVMRILYEQLDVPLPEKTSIIAEIAADLDLLYREYCEQGMNEADAEQAAIKKVMADSDTLKHFHYINTPTFRRLIERLPGRTGLLIEPLAILICISAIFSIFVTTFLDFPYLPSRIFFWLTSAVGFSVFSIGGLLIYRLFIANVHNLHTNHFLLSVLVWFGFLGGLLGLDGFVFDLFRFSYLYSGTSGTPFYEYFNSYGIIGLMHLNIGFTIALTAVIFWLISVCRLTILEHHDAKAHQILKQS